MYLINLGTIDNVKDFMNEVLKINSMAIVKPQKGRYVVDAKSIMGIFSLDLTQLLILEVFGEEPEFIERLKEMKILVLELNKTN